MASLVDVVPQLDSVCQQPMSSEIRVGELDGRRGDIVTAKT